MPRFADIRHETAADRAAPRVWCDRLAHSRESSCASTLTTRRPASHRLHAAFTDSLRADTARGTATAAMRLDAIWPPSWRVLDLGRATYGPSGGPMFDVIYLVLIAALFALSILMIRYFDRLW